ncbi:MAG: hypothetical protein JNN01_18905 [Opitutaceae bacterium]|nr:hypothetical protein [Opitutaceae bacterium]
MIKAYVFLAALVPFLAGCSTLTHQSAPGVELGKIKRVFVERRLADNNNVRDRFVRALQAKGFEAEAGPLTMMPEKGIDAVLVYEDRWAWDFRTYLVEVRVELRHPLTQALMAQAYLQRAPFGGKSTDDMVATVVDALFRVPKRRAGQGG